MTAETRGPASGRSGGGGSEGDGTGSGRSGGDLRPGTRLGIDVGEVRVGVARCDPGAVLATPLETLRRGDDDLEKIVALAEEFGAIEIVVGLPTHLSGKAGVAAAKATSYATDLVRAARARGLTLIVRLVDERLSTVSAQRQLREHGRKGTRQRDVIDQAAAVVILQHAIDTERSTGRPPGQEVRARP